ncbi:DDE_superfamily endonuclease domain-containing protein [Hexamita inflata]|uniref:DDE superfamily endonuclease domain-containing protein n=1 Tax=Hexamita inflata TaxID=28002 RepID=A0AA86UC54_9EUKA|nr:DDE superfamily endonuclease domain-containing protein [Hexamita inflata]
MNISTIYFQQIIIYKQNTVQIVHEARHEIHYAHPNSCELNPIENVFGIWKGRVDLIHIGLRPLENILPIIAESFFEITATEIYSCIRRVSRDIYGMVWAQEDI